MSDPPENFLHHEIKTEIKEEIVTFPCGLCDFEAESHEITQNHIQTAHIDQKKIILLEIKPESNDPPPNQSEIKKFKCGNCEYKTRWKHDLKRHLSKKHNMIQWLQCEKCELLVENRRSLAHHFCNRTNSAEKRYDCDKCDANFKHQRSLRHHERRKHVKIDEKIINCVYCEYKTTENSNLKRHMTNIHPTHVNWLQCEKCDSKFKSKPLLHYHMKSKHLPERDYLHCAKCDFKCKFRRNLRLHVANKHSGQINWLQCENCGWRFKTRKGFDRHVVRKHLKPEEIQWALCDQCGVRFKTIEQLNWHKMKHLNPEEIQWIQCRQCEYRCRLKPTLRHHVIRAHVREWFVCDRCPFKCKVRAQLKRHVVCHQGPEEVNWLYCDHCEYKSYNNRNLTRHVASRHKVTPK